jgi:hypothetical protein
VRQRGVGKRRGITVVTVVTVVRTAAVRMGMEEGPKRMSGMEVRGPKGGIGTTLRRRPSFWDLRRSGG